MGFQDGAKDLRLEGWVSHHLLHLVRVRVSHHLLHLVGVRVRVRIRTLSEQMALSSGTITSATGEGPGLGFKGPRIQGVSHHLLHLIRVRVKLMVRVRVGVGVWVRPRLGLGSG